MADFAVLARDGGTALPIRENFHSVPGIDGERRGDGDHRVGIVGERAVVAVVQLPHPQRQHGQEEQDGDGDFQLIQFSLPLLSLDARCES